MVPSTFLPYYNLTLLRLVDTHNLRSSMFNSKKNEALKVLIAMPQLKDSYFEKTVIFLCEYNTDGAMGFVVNIPSATSVDDLMQELNISVPQLQTESILLGGPVQPEFCWSIHTNDYKAPSTTPFGSTFGISSITDIIPAICDGHPPENYILGVGYAGWGVGQLDKEIDQESWWLAEIDPSLLLKTKCENRWEMAMDHSGLSRNSHTHFCRA